MFNLKRLPLLAAVAVLALPASSAFASGDATVTGTVNPGTLSISTTATPSFSVTLDGTDQTPNYTIPSTLTDATGSGAGWHLTVTSTQFTTGGGTPKTLATTASTITGVTNACAAGATCTDPTNNTYTYPVTIPAGATAPAAVSFFSADVASGIGKFDTTPAVTVAVPANAKVGSYSSTVTLAAVTGP